jgi:hypothetical protein
MSLYVEENQQQKSHSENNPSIWLYQLTLLRKSQKRQNHFRTLRHIKISLLILGHDYGTLQV